MAKENENADGVETKGPSAKDNATAVGKLIDTAVQSATNAGEAIHAAAIACAQHAAMFGDVSLCDRLLKELMSSKGGVVYVGGLRAWFRDHAPIYWSNDDKGGPVFPGKLLPKTSKERQALNAKFPEVHGDPSQSAGPGFGLEEAAKNPFFALDRVKRAGGREPVKWTEELLLKQIKGFKESMHRKVANAIEKGDIAAGVNPDLLLKIIDDTTITPPSILIQTPEGRLETAGERPVGKFVEEPRSITAREPAAATVQ